MDAIRHGHIFSLSLWCDRFLATLTFSRIVVCRNISISAKYAFYTEYDYERLTNKVRRSSFGEFTLSISLLQDSGYDLVELRHHLLVNWIQPSSRLISREV
jgi:hypothetical protein